jgi:hypothetical protein
MADIRLSSIKGNTIYRKQQVFTSSGTFTLPSTALAAVKLKVIAGGASGSAEATSESVSWLQIWGAGGGQIVNLDAVLTPGSSYACTVGAGGAAVTALENWGKKNGNNGGNSSFGTIATAVGGFASGRSGNGDFPLRIHEGTQGNTYSTNSYRNPPGTGGVFVRTDTYSSAYTAISAGVASSTTAPGGGGVRGLVATPVAPGAGAGGIHSNGAAGTIPGAAGGAAIAQAPSITSGAGFRGQIEIVYWDTVL